MKIAFYNTKQYDQEYFDKANQKSGHEIHYLSCHLNKETASLVQDAKVVCAFINDTLDADVLTTLKDKGVELIALRSAGFNHVDLPCAKRLNLPVVRVPAYSPYSIAEHAVGLLLCLNRGIHRAFNRTREGDFSISNLMGFDLHNKTIGVIGTGKIGQAFVKIMNGFGCKILAYDPFPSDDCIKLGARYVSLEEIYTQANVVSLHCPLTPETHHLINEAALEKMQDGVSIINTSRGKLVDSKAMIHALKKGKVGLIGLDVYEEEETLFFEDLSARGIQDDVLARLTSFPNVIITSHQGFFTHEAMLNIAETTITNINQFELDGSIQNNVT
ncbi:2-hydroxyacid dehydrogenase [uncultured Paraglaciecola sp.]|uniref:2-hydroxyacid dehydrogenase n=1 Tax=uncultured Paraglaciecola sp. TaxID=1765024 RepID=UPI002593B005|nr:2-hydroxyacid dehydrogenase [uncultured Paraglaciecola sp.]